MSTCNKVCPVGKSTATVGPFLESFPSSNCEIGPETHNSPHKTQLNGLDNSREGTLYLCSEERNKQGSFILSHTIMSIPKAQNPEREKIERYRKRKHTGRCWKYEWQGDFFSQKYFSRRLLIQEEELFLPECSKDQQFTWWTSTNKRVKFKSHCNCND